MSATPKQRAFADAIVAGLNPSEAYRAAGYSQRMSASSIAREAQRLLAHPNISPIVERGRRRAAKGAEWSREKAIARLSAINDAAYSALVAIAAGERFDNAARGAFFDSLDRLNALTDVGTGDRPDCPRFYDSREDAEASRSAVAFYFDAEERGWGE